MAFAKKTLPLWIMTFLLAWLLLAPAAFAETKVVEYDEIAKLVEKRNSNLEISDLAITELIDGIDAMETANEANQATISQVNASIATIKDLISGLAGSAGAEYDEASLNAVLGSLQAIITGSLMVDTGSMEQNLEVMELQLEQTKDTLVNAAQQIYVLCLQMDENIQLLNANLPLLAKNVQLAQIRLQYGLGKEADLREAQLQYDSALADANALQNQRNTLYQQLKEFIGMAATDTLILGSLPQPDYSYWATAELTADSKQAIKRSYAIKKLKIDYSYASSDNAEDRIELQIEQNKLSIEQELQQQYSAVLEAQTKLGLAETELAQAATQLQLAETSYSKGLLSQVAVEAQRSAYQGKQGAVQNARLNVFWEIESYRAICNGLSLSGSSSSQSSY